MNICLQCGSEHKNPKFCSRKCARDHYNQRSFEERFWKRVECRGPDECWPWEGNKNKKGYGIVIVGNNADFHRTTAHRVAFQLTHEVILPPAIEICHSCDNPSCCNPKHLFAGTHRDNIDDMVSKSRQAYGTRHHNAKLTDEQVLELRKHLGEYGAAVRYARLFGVNYRLVKKAMNGDRWKHLPMKVA